MSYYGHTTPQNPPDWLPAGWTVEVRLTAQGKNVKSYIHQQTGCRFYSKPKVLEFLGTVKNDSWTPQKEMVGSASYINFSEEMNGTAGSLPRGYVLETPQQEIGSQSGKSYDFWEEMNGTAGSLPRGYVLETPQQENDFQSLKDHEQFWEDINGTAGSLPRGYVLETPQQENGSQVGKGQEIGASEMLQHGEMVAEKSADWLPAGWTEEVKERNGRTVKTYVDPLWGHRFYSKPQVLQYLGVVTNENYTTERETSGNNSESNIPGKINETPELLPHASTLTTSYENGSQSKQGAPAMPHSSKIVTAKTPDWLPAGWTEEVNKLSNGRSVKCYIDSLTGRKFYSKPKVLEYLGTAKFDGGSSERKKIGNDFDINLPVQINDPLETLPHVSITELETRENGSGAGKSDKLPVKTIDSALPAGWITEVKHRKIGSSDGKSYEQYIDPVTGRKFFSKQKVFEYLGTVKPNSSTSRRKKTVLDDASEHIMDKNEFSTPQPQLEEPQNVKTPDVTIHSSILKERSYENRPGRKPYVDTSGSETLAPQLVESPNMKTLNHTGYTSILKETSCFEEPRKKIGMERLSPQELPPGWIKEIKIQKTANKMRNTPYYIDPASGYVFTTLIDAWRYVETGDTSKCVKKPKRVEEMGFANYGSSHNANSIGGGTPLPQPVESQNMKTLNHTGHTSILKETNSSEQPGIKIGVEHLSPQGLPPGWIKEIKIQKTENKTRQTLYYIDPVSGYVFSSLKDVWRYVEAGDIRKCLKRPKKREEMGFTTDQSSPNVDETVSSTPSPMLEEAKHVNTRKRTRFAPEDGKFSSSQQCVIERNVDNSVSNTPLHLLEGAEHVNTHKRTRFSPEVGNLSSSKLFDREIVIERVAAEGLPSGWIKEVKVEKFYTDPRSGYVFMSQKDALRYLETGDIGKCAIKPRSREELGLNEGATTKMDKTRGGPPLQPASGKTKTDRTGGPRLQPASGKKKTDRTGGPRLQHVEQSQNEYTPRLTRLASRQKEMSSTKQSEGEVAIEKVTPTSLATGSIKEDSIQKKATGRRRETVTSVPDQGKMDKTRANPALQPLKQSHVVSTPMHASFSSPQNEMVSSKQSGIEIVIERVPPEGLPPGWIKEIRIQKKADGIRKDPYYTDPVSGYVFSSQKDVFRYVETGDIRTCAMKPKSRDQLGLNQGNSAAFPPVTQKPGNDTARKRLSTGTYTAVGKIVSSKRSLETTHSDVPQKRQTRSSVASPTVMQKLAPDTTKKQLSAGNKSSSKRSLETTDTDVPSKRRQTRASSSVVTAKNPTVELPKEVSNVDNVTPKPRKYKRGTENPTVELPKEVSKVDNVTPKPRKSKRGTENPTVELAEEVIKVDNAIQKPTKAKKVTTGPTVSKEVPSRKATKAAKGEVIKVDNVIQKPAKPKKVTEGPTVSKEVPNRKPSKAAKGEVIKVDNVIQKPTKGKRVTKGPTVSKEVPNRKPTKAAKGNGSSRSQLSKVKVSMRKRGGTGSPPTNEKLQLKNVKKKATKISSKTKTHSLANETKRKETKKETRTPPSRFSKRVLGLNTETVPNSASSEQALAAEVGNSGEKDEILYLNPSNDVPSCKQALTSEVENSGEKEGIPCPNAPSNVASSEQALTSEVEDFGKDENILCPNAPDNVADNAPEQLVPVLDTSTTEVEKPVENKNMPSPNSPGDVPNNAPQELETIPDLDKTNHDLGGAAEAPSDAEVPNKKVDAAKVQAEDQTFSQEQPADVSNKSNEAKEDQPENQTMLLVQSADMSSINNTEDRVDQVEDRILSQEQPAEVSNKSNEASNQAEDQTLSLEQPADVSDKGKQSMEDQVGEQTASLEQPAELSSKSKEAMQDQAKNQNISQDQSLYHFGEESWSDPCLDFAFKTLTGTLPFEDNVQVQNIFQLRADTSQVKTADTCMTLLDFGATNARQVEDSHAPRGSEAVNQVDNSEALANSEPVMRLPSNPTFLPDMNSTLPSGTETAPEQGDSQEENKQ